MKSQIKTFTTKEVANYFNVHPATIRLWAKTGKIKEINLGYRTKRYDISDLIL